MTAAWPEVVGYLLATLPTLPGWDQAEIFDTNPLTGDVPLAYAVVGRTSDDNTSGLYVRQLNQDGGTVDETGSVRVHIVTQTGDFDPASVRASAQALADPLEDHLFADQTLGGVLGACGTVALTVDVQSISGQTGVAQSLVISVNYTARH